MQRLPPPRCAHHYPPCRLFLQPNLHTRLLSRQEGQNAGRETGADGPGANEPGGKDEAVGRAGMAGTAAAVYAHEA